MRSRLSSRASSQHVAHDGEHVRRPCPAPPCRAGRARRRCRRCPRARVDSPAAGADAAGRAPDALRQRDEIFLARAGLQQRPPEQRQIGQQPPWRAHAGRSRDRDRRSPRSAGRGEQRARPQRPDLDRDRLVGRAAGRPSVSVGIFASASGRSTSSCNALSFRRSRPPSLERRLRRAPAAPHRAAPAPRPPRAPPCSGRRSAAPWCDACCRGCCGLISVSNTRSPAALVLERRQRRLEAQRRQRIAAMQPGPHASGT